MIALRQTRPPIGASTLAVFAAVMAFALDTAHAKENYNEEFSNAILSDLAPLISLFGEQVTKQFLSGSLCWYDHIIFAMGPLGLLTAVVSAIRIGGPNWLKAVIGRARESKGAAEIELMSSTSHDVCELWNGSQLVRVMGSSPTMQILFFPSRKHEASCGCYTLEGAIEAGLLKKEHQHITPRSGNILRRLYGGSNRRVEFGDPENVSGPSNSRSRISGKQSVAERFHAPNIALNFAERVSSRQLLLFAMIGIVLQSAVLVFEAVITFHPDFKHIKIESPVSAAGFEFTVSGTVAILTGMILCSYIVEQSTEETTWTLANKSDVGFYIVWLQRGQMVSDQKFESFILFAKHKRTFLMTSRPRKEYSNTAESSENSWKRPGNDSTLGENLNSNSGSGKSEDEQASKRMEVTVIIATGLAVIGFVLQVIGMRGMHFSVTVAQLGTTLLMTVIRAWARRDLAERPFARRIPEGFELDWLATRLVSSEFGLDSYSRRPSKAPGKHTYMAGSSIPKEEHNIGALFYYQTFENHENFWGKNCIDWSVNTIHPSSTERTLDVDYRIKVRRRLKQITDWAGAGAETASSLASAIEVVMNRLDHNQEALWSTYRESGWIWSLSVSLAGENYAIPLNMRFNRKWRVDISELEAFISLWLYALDGKNLRGKKLHLLGQNAVEVFRDYCWWLSEKSSSLVAVKLSEKEERKNTDHTSFADGEVNVECFNKSEVFGYMKDLCLDEYEQTLEFTFTKIPSVFTVDLMNTQKDGYYVASTTYISPSKMCAMHIFTQFADQLAQSLSREVFNQEGVITTLNDNSIGDNYNLRLKNSLLEETVQGVEQTRLCNQEEARNVLVTALSRHRKLPISEVLVKWALNKALPLQTATRLKDAGKIYLWFFRLCKMFGWDDEPSLEGLAMVLEFLKFVKHTNMLNKELHYSGRFAQELLHLEEDLEDEIYPERPSAKDIGIFSALLRISCMFGRLPDWNHAGGVAFSRAANDGDPEADESSFAKIIDMAHKAHATIKDARQTTGNKVDHYGRSLLHYTVVANIYEVYKVATMSRPSGSLNCADRLGFTPLHYAAWRGNTNALEDLIKEHADVGVQGVNGMTPLHHAVLKGGSKATEMLIEAGAPLEAPDAYKRTPLHWAIMGSSYVIIKKLLEHGASTKAKDSHGRISLHFAALRIANASTYLIKELLHSSDGREKVDVDSRDFEGRSAFHLAAKAGHASNLRAILDFGGITLGSKDLFGRTALSLAAGEGHRNVVKHLLLIKADPRIRDNEGRTPILWAARNGHEEVVEMLLTHRHYIDDGGGTTTIDPLMFDLKGIDVELNSEDLSRRTPLSLAAENGHERVVEMLLTKTGIKVNAQDFHGRTPLSWAAAEGKVVVMEALLRKSGVDGNLSDYGGRTPFQWAAYRGRELVVEAMIKFKNIDVNATDRNFLRTPLSWAAGEGHKAVVELLLAHERVLVDARDSSGRTPLSWAAARGHAEVVKLLIENSGVQVDSRDEEGRTPLSWAAGESHLEVVRILMQRDGVDLNSKDAAERTPLLWHVSRRENPVFSAAHDERKKQETREGILRLLLLNPKIELECRDKTWGMSPLTWAAHVGDLMAAKILSEKEGVNLNARTHSNRTPLSHAAGQGHLSIVIMLLQKGSDRCLKDDNGFTPLAWAATMGHEEVVSVLLERGDEDRDELGLIACLAAKTLHEEVVRLLLEKMNLQSREHIEQWARGIGDAAKPVLDLVVDKRQHVAAEVLSPSQALFSFAKEMDRKPSSTREAARQVLDLSKSKVMLVPAHNHPEVLLKESEEVEEEEEVYCETEIRVEFVE